MDRRTPGVCCVLVLLVVRAAVSQDDPASITLDSMTWTADTLAVCSKNLSTDATSFRLVVNANPQTAIDGVSDGSYPICALFNITDLSFEPLANETTYELTAFYNATEELQSGAVTFAFPLSHGATVDCGGTSQFGRFVVTTGDNSALGASCFSGSAPGVCYINTDTTGTLCVPDLDEINTDFKVCVQGDSTVTIDSATISAVSLTYAEDRNSGSFTLTSDIETNPLELLSVPQGSVNNPSVTTCTDNACSPTSGHPSQDNYNLCAVYIDSSNNKANVGTKTFQDLQLTVDVVDTTVDFRFANLNAERKYDVYGGSTAEDLTTNGRTFTLDCTHIEPTSFCNGFFDNEDSSILFIGVASSGNSDLVIAPTTTPILANPPKVDQNAVDLTDQKTEGIVPSSA